MNPLVFGPILSRRFGVSLGINVIGDEKRCTMDCLYCELGRAKTTDTLTTIISVEEIICQTKEALTRHGNVDVLTVTANGEPTLYPHLKVLAQELKKLSGYNKLLILSNGSTIQNPCVIEALQEFDIVKLSLDAALPLTYKKIDRPLSHDITKVIEGMSHFRHVFTKELIIEILVVEGLNDTPEDFLALNTALARIRPDRVDVGSIDRPPAYDVKGVSSEKLRELCLLIIGQNVSLSYRKETQKRYEEMSEEEILATLTNRPFTRGDCEFLFSDETLKHLDTLVAKGKIATRIIAGTLFYTKNN